MATRVYVGRLTPRVREYDVERLFRTYGRIRDIMLKTGYCFVEFEDPRDADDATYECNGREFMGDKIIVEIAKGTPHGRDRLTWQPVNHGYSSSSASRYYERRSRSDARSEYRVVVDNLSSRVTWQDLKDFIRDAGAEVVHTDTDNRRNEGYVEFATRRDMNRAIDKLDGRELNGRRVRLFEDRPRRRSRSRSYACRRSRSRSSRRRRSSGSRRYQSRSSKSRSRSGSRSGSRDRSPDRKRQRSGRSESKNSERDEKEGSRDSDASPRYKKLSRSPSPKRRSRSVSKAARRTPEVNGERYSPGRGRSGSRDREVKKEDRKSQSRSRSRSRRSSPERGHYQADTSNKQGHNDEDEGWEDGEDATEEIKGEDGYAESNSLMESTL